ncbi:MAG: PilC/PilY family type IV pilus protein [Thermodesulfobacteriota bacterium]|nr:PilC/PilY family type IV pilus protein [Thermodesulfobacteriota bacterium]
MPYDFDDDNDYDEDDQAYVDASPTFADVKIDGTWTTVLLNAQGNGGDTVTCLDVTDPDNPTFMWEFADSDLYRSRSSAAVFQIGRIQFGAATKWVAFFVSGDISNEDQYSSIYLVDIETGNLIERVYLDADPFGDSHGKGGIASGQPASQPLWILMVTDTSTGCMWGRTRDSCTKSPLRMIRIPLFMILPIVSSTSIYNR